MVMESYYYNYTVFGDLLKVNGRYFNIQKHLICYIKCEKKFNFKIF